MELLIVVLLLFTGWMLSEIQDKHLKTPFLGRRGFALVSLGSFVFYILGAFVSLGYFFNGIY